MLTRILLVALVAMPMGCRSCHRNDSVQSTGDERDANAPTLSTLANTGPLQTVRHDCGGLPLQELACSGDASGGGAGDAMMLISEKLSELAALHRPPPSSWWDPARAALMAAARIEPQQLRFEERVAIQNAALFLALAANSEKGANDAILVRDAIALARRLAFSAAIAKDPRAAPANPPTSALDVWLGPSPSSSWIERSKDGVMFHEIVHQHTRVFRLVRTPSGVHANYSQLVAVDERGHPFLTPVLGSIEIRRGEADDSPACLGMLAPDRLRCGSGSGASLVAVNDLDGLPSNHFLRREAGRLKCNECHSARTEDRGMVLGTHDIDASSALVGIDAELARRRAMVLDELEKALIPLWR